MFLYFNKKHKNKIKTCSTSLLCYSQFETELRIQGIIRLLIVHSNYVFCGILQLCEI